MPSLKETKRRIGSVKNTQKITRAMKLVASAKYARSNINLMKSRPYGNGFNELVRATLASGDLSSPLLEERKQKKNVRLVIVAADRGLCGPLNSSVFKLATSFLRDFKEDVSWSFDLWGRRAIKFGSSLEGTVVSSEESVLESPDHFFAKDHFNRLAKEFVSGDVDEVYVLHPSFQTALSQPPVVEKLLPLGGLLPRADNTETDSCLLFEPSAKELLDPLLEKFGAVSLYNFLLESATAEHAARVAAMDSATSNADKVIKDLTLQYNRARQASITTELIEITAGAEAL